MEWKGNLQDGKIYLQIVSGKSFEELQRNNKKNPQLIKMGEEFN